MGRTNKYLMLFLLIAGGLITVVLAVVLLVFLLKLFAGVIAAVPGSDAAYRLIVSLVPYLIYSLAYFLLFRYSKTINSGHWGKPAARVLMVLGTGICLLTAVLALMVLSGSKHPWAVFFDAHSYLSLTAQIILFFFTTMFMALAGEEK